MSHVLGNHIILAIVLENLPIAADIVALSRVDTNIRYTLLSILPYSRLVRLSFSQRSRLKSKHLTTGLVQISSFRYLILLNLSGTDITASTVRTLVFNSKTLQVLQIVECLKISVDSLIALFRSVVKLRFGKRDMPRDSFAPLVCLDCWGIRGLCLDYKFQGKKEWMYESFCADNRNLWTLSEETAVLGIDTNIRFCTSADHTSNDIRYRPALRYTYGVSQCELVTKSDTFDEDVALCETCILRNHNKLGNPKHKCRTPVPINLSLLSSRECIN